MTSQIKERCAIYRNTTKDALQHGSQSVARALTVLNLFEHATQEMGVRDIARRLALPASIVHRLVSTLARFGYLEQSPLSRRYRVGYKAFQIGNVYLTGSDITELSLPELRALADQHQLNAFLGVLRDGAVVYLATIQAAGPIAIRNVPGSRTFLHSTALGKALIAGHGATDVAALLGSQPYRRLTPKTITRLKPLLADLRDTQRRGYSLSDGENLGEVISIGAPVRDGSGRTIAAISGALPRSYVRDADLAPMCRLVMQAAARISRRLGAPVATDGKLIEPMAAG